MRFNNYLAIFFEQGNAVTFMISGGVGAGYSMVVDGTSNSTPMASDIVNSAFHRNKENCVFFRDIAPKRL